MKLCKGHPTVELCPCCAVLEEIVGLLDPIVDESKYQVHVIYTAAPAGVCTVINRMIESESNIIADGAAAGYVKAVVVNDYTIRFEEYSE